MDQDKKELKILTFNWHEPYISNLAKTGYQFYVVSYNQGRAGERKWNEKIRPIPSNVSLIDNNQAVAMMKRKSIDLVISHTIRDQYIIKDFSVRSILIFHNYLTSELAIGANTVSRSKFLSDLMPIIKSASSLVFISEGKKQDWNLDIESNVILHGIDTDLFKPSDCRSKPSVLRCINLARVREMMFDLEFAEKVLDGFDSLLIGESHDEEDSVIANGVDDLVSIYGKYRVYLHIAKPGYEDGINLSMLEAMSSGTSVVTNGGSGSPIIDKINGFSSTDPAVLRSAILKLMENPELAKKIGLNGRESVKQHYSIEKFATKWSEIIEKICSSKKRLSRK